MVRSVAARLVPVLAVVAMLVGCFVPIFDLDTSLAYRTAGRMTKVATVGPMDFHDDRVSSATDYYFVPSLRAFPDHGTLVRVDNLGAQVAYFAPDPVDGLVREIGGDGFSRDGLLPSELDLVVSPLRNSTFDDAFFVAVRREGDIDLRIYRVDLAARQISFPTGATESSAATLVPAYDTPVSVALDTSDADASGDMLSVFMGDSGSSGTLFLDQAPITTDSFPALAHVLPDVAVPGGAVPAAAFATYNTDLDTYAFSGWSADGSYSVFTRDAGDAVTDLGGIGRIDSILSDGRLYHRGASSDLVYNPAGELELTIPTGRLRFAYETGTVPPTMIYTIAYFDTSRDNEFGNFFVDIYSIPTTDLAELE